MLIIMDTSVFCFCFFLFFVFIILLANNRELLGFLDCDGVKGTTQLIKCKLISLFKQGYILIIAILLVKTMDAMVVVFMRVAFKFS